MTGGCPSPRQRAPVEVEFEMPPARLLAPHSSEAFPDPRDADDEGLLAIGGDLGPQRLLAAYDHGIFPWYNEGLPVLWWSPNPRGVLEPARVHVSRSMRRVIRRADFELTWNADFRRILRECAAERAEGTWLIEEMQAAYQALHEHGFAHSLEVWSKGQLVGGIYGVQRGRLFAAESMFHRRTNGSKIALIALAHTLATAGVELMDVQFVTPHLASLGAVSIRRDEYLRRVAHLHRLPCDLSQARPSLPPIDCGCPEPGSDGPKTDQ